MISWLPTGFEDALSMTLDSMVMLAGEEVGLDAAVGRVAFQDAISQVDSPSIDASLKDGYAVVASDLTGASENRSVRLKLMTGRAAAGIQAAETVSTGCALRILTGARVPEGADAVLSEEFATRQGDKILARIDVTPGRNILPRGTDVAVGQVVAKKGAVLTPGRVGIIAAAGWSRVTVYRQPKVAIIATGDEVVAPGRPLPEGKLYASNMVTLGAFCREWGMFPRFYTAVDEKKAIRDCLEDAAASCDAVITSGGAWTGDRDLVAEILSEMGWHKQFHRIRMGPGKAVGFGTLDRMPVFILPGGPPSNLMGFLQIAFPGLRRLGGILDHPGLPEITALPDTPLHGRDRDWTQFIFGELVPGASLPRFTPLRRRGRLQSMARATAVAAVPEGFICLEQEKPIRVQMLSGAMG